MSEYPCEHLIMTFRGWGRRSGEKIALVTCLECNEKFQISRSGVMYQVKRRSELPTKTVHVSARITEKRMAEILTKWGTFQNYADGLRRLYAKANQFLAGA